MSETPSRSRHALFQLMLSLGLVAGLFMAAGPGSTAGMADETPGDDTRASGIDPETDAARLEPWWPSPWGAEDERGNMNLLTPEKVLEAAALIETGKLYDLGREFDDKMPLMNLPPNPRKFTSVSVHAPLNQPVGRNALVWNDDYVSGHITQDGTQFDSLAHMATHLGEKGDKRDLRYYNGFRHSDIAGPYGFSKLGVEKVTPIFTRGVLLDFAGLKGRMIEIEEEITVADIRAALERQGLSEDDIRAGDALFYNTGWGELWKVDNDKFNSGSPGLSDKAGDWVVARQVVLVGTDNWSVEAIPNPEDPELFAPNHQKFLIRHGIHIMENMDFTPLIEDETYVFAFSFAPIAIKGATGSPARPFAIR
ncbi:MAG: cyclase family protein [Alphaproteobacteria bacterium]